MKEWNFQTIANYLWIVLSLVMDTNQRTSSGRNIETTVNKIMTLLRICSCGQETNEDLVMFFVLDKIEENTARTIFAANGGAVDLSTVISTTKILESQQQKQIITAAVQSGLADGHRALICKSTN